MTALSISMVVFEPDLATLRDTLRALSRAISGMGWSSGSSVTLCIVDNSSDLRPDWVTEHFPGPVDIRIGHGNIGFGRGHNLVLGSISKFHLVLNPDAELARDALAQALAFMVRNPECGLLSPAAFWDDGMRQYLCKRYPAVLDLLVRGFAPARLKQFFRERLEHYEMRDLIGDDVVWDPPIVSGCFMLFRGDVLRRLGGFDPRFFLYFEDFDISIRAAEISRIAYVPSVRIVHHGGHAARKGWAHVGMFVRSGIGFFNKHGWRWW